MSKLKITLAPITNDRKMNPIRLRSDSTLRYVYNIEGTPEQITEYKKEQPKALIDDKTGHVLFMSKTFHGQTNVITKSEKGNWYVDTIAEQQFAEFCKQGGVEYAKMKMAELKG